jgi:hypothetical protein
MHCPPVVCGKLSGTARKPCYQSLNAAYCVVDKDMTMAPFDANRPESLVSRIHMVS